MIFTSLTTPNRSKSKTFGSFIISLSFKNCLSHTISIVYTSYFFSKFHTCTPCWRTTWLWKSSSQYYIQIQLDHTQNHSLSMLIWCTRYFFITFFFSTALFTWWCGMSNYIEDYIYIYFTFMESLRKQLLYILWKYTTLNIHHFSYYTKYVIF